MEKAKHSTSKGCIVCGESAHRFRMCRTCFKEMRFDQQMRFDLGIPDCSLSGCRRMQEVGEYCGRHYERRVSGMSGDVVYSGGECSIPGCAKEAMLSYPLCRYHKKFAGRYGMTPEHFTHVMVNLGECAICGETNDLHIDHDHSCCDKKYGTCGLCNRGVLCRGCNFSLGGAKDNPQTLRALADYLESGNRI